MLAFILIWVAVAAVYLYYRSQNTAFKRSGVKHLPTFPVVGNMAGILLQKEHFVDDLNKMYFTFPDEKFVGRFEFMNKNIFVRDLDLAKKITIKDFEYFLDHRMLLDDPLFGRNLFSLKGLDRAYAFAPLGVEILGSWGTGALRAYKKLSEHYRVEVLIRESNGLAIRTDFASPHKSLGQEWKDMRSTLSPAFTSSKIRLMVPFMVEVGEQMMRTLKNDIEASGVGYVDADIKDLTTRYANDVVASCAFGLKVDSHKDIDNEFYAMGKDASTFNFKQLVLFLMCMSFPKTMKFLKVNIFSKVSQDFFRQLVNSTMQDREKKNIIRPDMIHLLMEAKKGKLTHDDKAKDTDAGFATVEESSVGKKDNIKREWSQDDLVAQAILFFIAGFETVSSSMCFLLHELALNPDVQERLVQEIKENDRKNGGKFDYNSIQNMVYMDMVVSEALRLWPPGVALDRICTKDYNLGRPNKDSKEDYIVRKGDGVGIPVWCFHRDPKYFPNPLKFDPERFSEENKHKIDPFSYMPFGVGPRNCIGSRFALCEVKVMAYQLLQHMEVSLCPKTCIPIRLSKDTFQMKIEGGHWLRITPRK